MLKCRQRVGENKGEWTEKVDIRTRKMFLVADEEAWLYSDLL